MSERPQNLMRSRCPECGTVLRVTSEQLRLKAGKVRCGQCRTVFNAFDQLLVGAGGQDNPPTIMPMPSIAPLPEPPKAARSAGAIAPATAPARTAEPIAPPPAEEPGAGELAAAQPDPDTDSSFSARQTTVEQGVGLPAVATELPAAETATSGPEPAAETLEQTLQAARAAGLVAAREVVIVRPITAGRQRLSPQAVWVISTNRRAVRCGRIYCCCSFCCSFCWANWRMSTAHR